MYKVGNIELDLVNYEGPKSIQPLLSYFDGTNAVLVIKRLDVTTSAEGWDETLSVLIHDHDGHIMIVSVGPSLSNLKLIGCITMPDVVFAQSSEIIDDAWFPTYKPFRQFEHYPQYISRDHFNNIFGSDVVELPSSLFALGMKDGGVYIYHDAQGQYTWDYEIKYTIDFIISMMFARTPREVPPTFYCILCALDGYIEQCYPSPNRTTPVRVGEIEYRNKSLIDVSAYRDNEYPVFHAQKYILGQSVRKHIPYTIPTIDRYYLYLNRYNGYRSIHRGIPFKDKFPAIVYAGNDRGSKYNFLMRKDIPISQRAYFASDVVDKTHVVTGNVPRDMMINYKYILDIDGNACTWDATAWKLNSGSVILKTDSEWVQWFYEEYVPWVHYVPVKDDFFDLQDKFAWCESHQAECAEMVKKCKALFQKIYRHDNVVKYMEGVILKFAKEYAATSA